MKRNLMKEGQMNKEKIKMVLASSKNPMTLTEIKEATGLPFSTVKRHLDILVSTGEVHIEHYRGFNLYRWNGEKIQQDKVFLSDDHVLLIDTIINPYGMPVIRIKERKQGNDIGAITISEKVIDEFVNKLLSISKTLTTKS
ncbi:MAG: helix-turn-helix domain-containing protein [Candidatus Thermoplasmatota archaeon]